MPSAFVPQSSVPTGTPRTRPRVAWLDDAPEAQAAWQAALAWLRDHPEDTAVTAAFLAALSPADIDALLESRCPGASADPDLRARTLRRVKQELGMYVPIRLCRRFGPAEVLTLRDGRRAAPRKIPPAFRHLDWVGNYTPHRLTPAAQAALEASPQPDDAQAPLGGLRGRVGFAGRYEAICREERHLAALLFAALQDPAKLDALLALIGVPAGDRPAPDEAAVFFEFAMLRDLWSTCISGDDALARAVILEHLPGAPERLRGCSVAEFNRSWGATPPSSRAIQMPARWSVPALAEQLRDDALLAQACRFKWAFNAKPDLVIRTGRDRAVCVEVKLESGVGTYPSSARDKAVFRERGLAPVRQTEIQRVLMEELLGFETTFVLLGPDGITDDGAHRALTWSQVWTAVELDRAPAHARRAVRAALARGRGRG